MTSNEAQAGFVKGKGWTFAQVPIALIMEPEMSSSAKVLFCYLVWRQGTKDNSWPSMRTMAKDMYVREKTVREWTRELEDAGYLSIEHRNGHSNLYVIHAEKQTPNKNVTPTPNKNVTQNYNHLNDIETLSPIGESNGIPFSDPLPIEEDTEYTPCDEDGDVAEAKPAKKKRKPQGWKRQALEDAEIFANVSRIAVPPNPNGSNGEYARQNTQWFLPLKRIRYQVGTDEVMRTCLEQAVIEQRKWRADSVNYPLSIEKKAIAIAGMLKAKAEEAKPERRSWYSTLTGEWYDAETDTHHPGPGQIGYNADAGT